MIFSYIFKDQQFDPDNPLYYRHCGGVVHSDLNGLYKMGECINHTIPFKHTKCFCNCNLCNHHDIDIWGEVDCFDPFPLP